MRGSRSLTEMCICVVFRPRTYFELGAAVVTGEPLGQQAPAPTSPGAGRSEASRNAPAAAGHTEYDSGGSGPRATVIVTANTDNRTPVARANAHGRTPTRRPTASATSSTVDAHPAARPVSVSHVSALVIIRTCNDDLVCMPRF